MSSASSITIAELQQLAAISKADTGKYSIKSWINSVTKLYEMGDLEYQRKDYTNAYFHYWKGCSIIIDIIKQHPHFKVAKNDLQYHDLEKRTEAKVLPILEDLTEKLSQEPANTKQFHDTQSDTDKSSDISQSAVNTHSSVNGHENISKKTHQLDNNVNNTPLAFPPPTTAKTQVPRNISSSAPPLRSTSHGSSPSSVQLPNQTNNIFQVSPVVEPLVLARWITAKQNPPSVLILDIRPREEFSYGCIKHPWIVQIEPLTLRKGVTSRKIQESLVLNPEPEQQMFSERHRQFDVVVFYDRNSTMIDGAPEHIQYLKSAIADQEYVKILPRKPMLLQGGFDAWKSAVGERGIYCFIKPQQMPQPNVGSNGRSTSHWLGQVVGRNPEHGPQRSSTLHHTLYDYFNQSTVRHHSGQSGTIASTSTGQSLSPGIASTTTGGSTQPSTTPTTKTFTNSITSTQESFAARYPEIFPNSSHGNHLNSSESTSSTILEPIKRQHTFIDNPYHGFTSTSNSFYETPPKPNMPVSVHPSIKSPAPAAPQRPPKPAGLAEASTTSNNLAAPISSSSISQLGSVKIGTTGLKNLGNTCYMNSIIQCLSGTVPLARYFISGAYKGHINRNNPLGTKGILTEGFSTLLRRMWGESDNFLSPATFRETLVRFAPQFKGSQQQDSQEFLNFLLDKLHEDVNLAEKRTFHTTDSPEYEKWFESLPNWQASAIAWERYLEHSTSIIVSLFHGQLWSQPKCTVCGKTSTKFEAFMCLTLPIPSKRLNRTKLSLYHCLDEYVKKEILDHENGWDCPRCKQKRRATKELSISKLPDVLIITLKRFSNDGRFSDKLETEVEFPLRGLDMSRYVNPSMLPPKSDSYSQPSFKYDLYGVSNHYGSLVSGHYTACVRNGYRGEWHNFDDSRVSVCDERSVKVRGL